MSVTLIYCAGGNVRFADIALEAGFKYGSRLPDTVYRPLYFADNDWKKPNRALYMKHLQTHRPEMATVLDWEHSEQLDEVLDWAEEASQYTQQILIIPKVINEIHRIPFYINQTPIILAYSVPTKYGGTQTPTWEYANRRVHLLGGAPHVQMVLWRYLSGHAEIVSVDGNLAHKMATRWCSFWSAVRPAYRVDNRWWPRLDEGASSVQDDAPYEAFARSCVNIAQAWKELAS